MTVAAASAAEAEVLAKTLFLAGSAERATAEAEALGIPAVLVTRDGATLLAGGLGMKSDPTFWILARASGLVAYALLTSSVLAGLVLKARPFGRSLRPATVTDLHRFLALLGLGALVAARARARPRQHRAHLACGAARPRTRPLPAALDGLGVLAAELMLLVYASFSVRTRIGIAHLAAPALGHLPRLRPRHRPRARRRHRQRHDRGRSRSTAPPSAPSSPPPPGAHSSHPPKEVRTVYPHRDRPLAV